ncbi:MAG: hypothetical protein ACE5EE_07745 [Fidelibacterota bacterium]
MKKELKQTVVLISVSALLALVIILGLYNRTSDKISKANSPPVTTSSPKPSKPEERIDLTPFNKDVTLSTVANLQNQAILNSEESETKSPQNVSPKVSDKEYHVPGDENESFSEAFRRARRKLGSGKIFIWKGAKYTTNFASELHPVREATLTSADSAGKDNVPGAIIPNDSATIPEVSIPVSKEILLSTSRGVGSGSSSATGK